MKIFLLLILSVYTILNAQDKAPADSVVVNGNNIKPDTALYDMYGFNYKVSQPIKYAIMHSSIGAATALSIYGGLWLNGTVQDEWGIGFMVMPIVGGSIGLISGSVYGIYKGVSDEKVKKENDKFYHKSGKYGFIYGTGFTSADEKFSVNMGITVDNDFAKKYYPDKISFNLEYTRWNGRVNNADEFKAGVDGRYYISHPSFVNLFYGFGLGVTRGKYWYEKQSSWNSAKWDKHNFIFFYTNTYLGCGLNIFDFFNANASIVFEPISSQSVIKPGNFGFRQMFMFKMSAGVTVF